MLLQRLLNLLVLTSVNLLDPVLHLLALVLQPQIQLALQLDGLLFLRLALCYLRVMPLQLIDDLLFFELHLANVTLDFLGPLELLVRLLFIVNLPSLLHVFLLCDHALICRGLLPLDRGEKIVPIELLDLGRGLHVVGETLLVRPLRLSLLVVEILFSVEQFLMELLDLVVEAAMLLL